MNKTEKISYARDFFEGKSPDIHPMFVKPPKTLKKYADSPDTYMDLYDPSITYTPQEVEELGKSYFLIIVKIVR